MLLLNNNAIVDYGGIGYDVIFTRKYHIILAIIVKYGMHTNMIRHILFNCEA